MSDPKSARWRPTAQWMSEPIQPKHISRTASLGTVRNYVAALDAYQRARA